MKLPILLLVLFSTAGLSQRNMTNSEFEKRLELYKKIATLKAEFKQVKTIKEMGIEMKSKGELSVERPSKVRWRVSEPGHMELTLNGTEVEFSTGEGSSKKTEKFSMSGALDPAVSKSLLSMMAWLRVDTDAIQETYQVTQTGKDGFICVSKEPTNAVFKSLSFSVHSKGHLDSLKIEEKSGDTIFIQFSTPTVTYLK